jgi:hypothetical protein
MPKQERTTALHYTREIYTHIIYEISGVCFVRK